MRRKPTLRESLSSVLGEGELSYLKTGHDVVGNIAILEIDRPLRKRRFQIARAIMAQNKNIKTVLMKQAAHETNFRTQRMGFVMGRRTKEAVHTENNVRLMLDAEKVYFSPRLAGERMRIARQVRQGERVLVMFSGCGPYVFTIAKHSKANEVVGVEMNPVANAYAERNKALNKAQNVMLYCGDVRKVVPSLGRFDHIVMPLPKGGEDFLDIALKAAGKACAVHFYDFLHQDDIPKAAQEKILRAAKAAGRKAKILSTVRCGQQKARVYRTCTDFIVR